MKLRLLILTLIVFGVSQIGFCETPDAVQTAAAPENSELFSALIKL
mgnify:CR=1 FL=1